MTTVLQPAVAGKTALVLSAGGTFGAYQVGVWRRLATIFQPDLVIGASVGSLNAWAIAGGCPPDDLAQWWLDRMHMKPRFRRRPTPLGGLLEADEVEDSIQSLHAAFRPQREFALLMTDLWRMQPVLVRSDGVTWQHLAASCAVLGFLPQRRIDGRLYSDGGLAGALPLWAALEMGATRIIAVNVLNHMPLPARAFVQMAQRLRRGRTCETLVPAAQILTIEPREPLGTPWEAGLMGQDRLERWMARGERDAAVALPWLRGEPQPLFCPAPGLEALVPQA